MNRRCSALSFPTSRNSAVQITENVRSKLSPALRTSPGSTSSPRTSIFPKLNCQIATSSFARRFQRQPLIIPRHPKIVNPFDQLFSRIFDPFSSGRDTDKTSPISLRQPQLRRVRIVNNPSRRWKPRSPLSLPLSYHAFNTNGPCRNRTYNLAIKSRLLCQLS